MLDPVFIDGGRGRIHCTLFRPATTPRAGLLWLPPFAEEMNRSRRMMAGLGHALAARGWLTALPDLCGTGDSAGDFAAADWSVWRDDVTATARRLAAEGVDEFVIGGVRSGALLALDVLATLAQPSRRVLLWQPLPSGRLQLRQFLRLRVAAAMGGAARESTADLQARLDAGETVEIAGYDLSPSLAGALAALELEQLMPPPGVAVDWLEVGAGEAPEPGVASMAIATAWRAAGHDVHLGTVAGDPFWTTQEIAWVQPLIDRTVACLDSAVAVPAAARLGVR